MSTRTLLERLCEHYRIAPEYFDIWGRHHPASEQTRRSLLAAMGVPTGTGEAMEQALARVEAAEWTRILPPVQVVREGEESVRLRICLRASQAEHHFRWLVAEEEGARHNGEFRAADLELRGQKNLEGETRESRELVLSAIPGCGYHRLELHDLQQPEAPPATMSIIVTPRTCYQPEVMRGGGRVWGPAIQLYALRSARNWGIGDFTDLVHLLEFAAQAGAGLVGLNPLHALFPHNPAHASPYSPSSRLLLNILYLDVESVPDFAECEPARQRVADAAFQARLRALRAAELVDYAGVAGVKLEILNALYQHFRQRHLDAGSDRGGAFRRFQEERGEALHRHALFETLQAWLHERDPDIGGWGAWPAAYRDPGSEAVAAFAAEHAERVEFFAYLQWQAHEQFQAAGHRAWQLGLGVGLYLDLAVSVDAGGAEAWANQSLYALNARIGSPPDDFNLKGQDWGLPPWSPQRLQERAYGPFIDTLRENMQTAGALRIDHVMALMRLFWVPPGRPPVEGSYVHYPLQDLLGILALESRRNHCLVIGEDLGTVPDEVRRALHPLGVLSCRLLYFQKTADGGFLAPQDFEPQALVAASSHDLPPLAGYWQGRDLELREQLGLFPDAGMREQQVIARAEDRARLLIALEREDLLPAGMSVQAVATPEMTPELALAIHQYLARTPSRAMVVQLEDILGQVEQVNLPGTTDQQPNWCRKLTLDLELWERDARFAACIGVLRQERGSAVKPPPQPPPARPRQAVIPRSTYRLQFHRGFTFDQGAELIPYLHRLGISHCYASPCLQARPGSPHGYDIIDHGSLNTEPGGEAAFQRLTAALHGHRMGLLLDMVPNHMGVMGSDNAWWLEVLENGPAATYAPFFDIDWDPLKEALRNKVLVPVLGDHYGSALARGELALVFDSGRGAFSVRYFEHEFPIDPREYPRILAHDMPRLEERLGGDDPLLLEYQSLVNGFRHLPPRSAISPAQVAERARDKEVHKAGLVRLYRDTNIARYLDENLHTFNDRGGIERLHELLENQAWRLAYWRVASDEINYRRFFDINELAGLRMENPQVFEATHGLVLELIAQGRVQGLRIDHPDGLYDPAGYFRHLQTRVAAPGPVAVSQGGDPPSDDDAAAERDRPLYLLVEKILAGHERLRDDWDVHGTTGYEFANMVNGLFVDEAAGHVMQRIYREFIGRGARLDEQVYRCKKLIMAAALASELHVLAQQLSRIAERDRQTRDFTLSGLHEALSEIVAWFPVYRTYLGADGAGVEDRRYVDWAVNVAKKRSPAADTSVFDFVREVLLADIAEGKSDVYRQQVIGFALKFQQYTGPVMAKALEDTAFYRYTRLISLNEVGGAPERFGVSVEAFHHQNQERARSWPHAMLGSSTHDSKRSEDVRARINVLSELPGEWRRRVRRWTRLNQDRKCLLDDRHAPSRNDEYLLYQTLVGAWPLEELDAAGLAGFRERIRDYMLKAVKEAKVHTSWINPDSGYETAVTEFVEALLGDLEKSPFLADFRAFQRSLVPAGLCNGLAQTLLKLTAPGVPDIYQGNELWDFSLVDPDNRRPVNYSRRQALLTELEKASAAHEGPPAGFAHALWEHCEDGRVKLYLTWRSLQLRREQPGLFRDGDYQPLAVSGRHAGHLCAFARRHGDRMAVTVVPRLVFRLTGGDAPLGDAVWEDTRIEVPAGDWTNWLTGESLQAEPVGTAWQLPAGRVLCQFPVALLQANPGP
jgi:(1->4)-alpha-D-glucan 1-alpha-D-glucosylmutase